MLFGLKPNIGDLCEIYTLNYKDVKCEIIDVNHDEFLYKILFSHRIQEVFWMSSDKINWIARKYKIISIESIDHSSENKATLIVEATPYNIIYHETDDKIHRYELFNDNLNDADTFIFDANSNIATYILNNSEKQKIFNLTHFKKGEIDLDSQIKEVLFHEDY